MGAILFRLALLALGMGLIEIGLTDALGQGSLSGWALVLLGGFPLILVGTAGFIGPLVTARHDRGDEGHE
jgi:hypothetical protein